MAITSIIHKKGRRKFLWIFPLLFLLYFFLFCCPYKYDNNRTVDYIKSHYNAKSRCMCAWYVMMAVRSGGCTNCYLYPAYAYNKILPQLGFKEISSENYIPMKGDISVLPQNVRSSFGHIAVYDGNNWISDFKQVSIYPGKVYEDSGEFQIFRIDDGWHYPHLKLNLLDVYDYLKALSKGYKRIII